MKMKKTREALTQLDGTPGVGEVWSEVEQAESLLREAAALKVFAAAGLSAFHGRLCSMASGAYPENASECADPKCRAWAKAVQGEAAEDAWSLKARVEFLEEREKHIAAVLDVADGGQYRNDWDGAVERLKRDARNAALEEAANLYESEREAAVVQADELRALNRHDTAELADREAKTAKQLREHIRALKRGG